MLKTCFTLIREAGRFFLYAFVLGPALALYGLAMFAASDGSLSRQLLNDFYQLTDGMPPGKVMRCVNAPPLSPLPQNAPDGDVKHLPPHPVLPPPPVEVLCQKGPVDTEVWVHANDATLWNLWVMASVLGAMGWFVSGRFAAASQRRRLPSVYSAVIRDKKEESDEC